MVGLLTVMIFFQSKKFTACKIKDEEEEIIFYCLMVFNLLKITLMKFRENKLMMSTSIFG